MKYAQVVILPKKLAEEASRYLEILKDDDASISQAKVRSVIDRLDNAIKHALNPSQITLTPP